MSMTSSAFARLAAASGIVLLSAVASSGEELHAYAAKTVTLDALSGTLYFTAKNGEYAVVATFDNEPRPVRLVAMLQPGQRIELSSPRALGEPASVVEIRRDGDRVVYETRPRSADPVPSPGEPDLLSGP
jgi:hypothetical protein